MASAVPVAVRHWNLLGGPEKPPGDPCGQIAQLVRAPRLHRGGRGFEPLFAHFKAMPRSRPGMKSIFDERSVDRVMGAPLAKGVTRGNRAVAGYRGLAPFASRTLLRRPRAAWAPGQASATSFVIVFGETPRSWAARPRCPSAASSA
jgi:hypothetical protein